MRRDMRMATVILLDGIVKHVLDQRIYMGPHAVQMALVTDHRGARRGSESAIASRDVIAAQNAASEAFKGLGQRPGGGGRSSPQGKGRLERGRFSAFSQLLGVLI